MTQEFQNDPALNQWLAIRHFEPASEGLAHRIIAAAHGRAQYASPSFADWLNALFAEFALPRPAYVLASLLCLAFLAGFGEGIVLPDETGTPSLQSFLYDEGDIL